LTIADGLGVSVRFRPGRYAVRLVPDCAVTSGVDAALLTVIPASMALPGPSEDAESEVLAAPNLKPDASHTPPGQSRKATPPPGHRTSTPPPTSPAGQNQAPDTPSTTASDEAVVPILTPDPAPSDRAVPTSADPSSAAGATSDSGAGTGGEGRPERG